MSKTVPQLVKIVDREDVDRVSVNVEPYPWQKTKAAPKSDSGSDPFAIPTVRLLPDQDKKRR